jgi:hypothetical protein
MTKKDWEKEFKEIDRFIRGMVAMMDGYNDLSEGITKKLKLEAFEKDILVIKQSINSLLVKQKKESETKGFVEGLLRNPFRKTMEKEIKKEIIEKLEKLKYTPDELKLARKIFKTGGDWNLALDQAIKTIKER